MRQVAVGKRKLGPGGKLLEDGDRLLGGLERLGSTTDIAKQSRERPDRLPDAPAVVELSVQVERRLLRPECFVDLAAQVTGMCSTLKETRQHLVRRVIAGTNRAREVGRCLPMRAQRRSARGCLRRVAEDRLGVAGRFRVVSEARWIVLCGSGKGGHRGRV